MGVDQLIRQKSHIFKSEHAYEQEKNEKEKTPQLFTRLDRSQQLARNTPL